MTFVLGAPLARLIAADDCRRDFPPLAETCPRACSARCGRVRNHRRQSAAGCEHSNRRRRRQTHRRHALPCRQWCRGILRQFADVQSRSPALRERSGNRVPARQSGGARHRRFAPRRSSSITSAAIATRIRAGFSCESASIWCSTPATIRSAAPCAACRPIRRASHRSARPQRIDLFARPSPPLLLFTASPRFRHALRHRSNGIRLPSHACALSPPSAATKRHRR